MRPCYPAYISIDTKRDLVSHIQYCYTYSFAILISEVPTQTHMCILLRLRYREILYFLSVGMPPTE